MRFSDIIGLEETKQKLISAVKENHVAHAQLFFGAEGSANLAMSLAFATYINCTNPSDTDSCGECSSCKKIDKLVHPDVQFVFPVSSTKKVTGKSVVSSSYLPEWRNFALTNPYNGIEQWSSFYGAENKQANISKEESRNIIKNLSLKAFEAKYKVMLIWLPEYMHVNAANGILKILEEPPAQTIFLLVTNDYEKLLTTILSRCQLLKIRTFSEDEVAHHLEKAHGVDSVKANKIAALAEGNLNKASTLINEIEDDAHKMFRDWMRLCWTRNFSELTAMNDVFSSMNKSAQMTLLLYGLNMMREALIAKLATVNELKLNEEESGFVKNFGKALSLTVLEKISGELNKAHYHLGRNASPKILFMDMSLTIGRLMTSK
ncbi:DNA polymerase III subunit delta [Reichenbachiella sp. MALMAid0571]|uniref:DNA polymerase III subunit n=1 Tax=Reichenbachiella sp. MALMAid0571 TaxID=3143939 RepID=UPI0032DE2BC8